MAEHLFRVGTLRTDIAVLAGEQSVAPLRGRLDRALTQSLPPLLAELSGPVLDHHDGVIRIRKLEIHLDHAGPFDETVIMGLLAARIAAALREALTRPGGKVVFWPDTGAYLAAYVENRLGLEPGPDWPFAEFSGLALLSPSEAAVEMLRTRPGLLAQLAANGAAAGNPDRLLTRLDNQGCAAVLDAVFQAARPGRQNAEDLARLARSFDPDDQASGSRQPARTALALILRTSAPAAGAGPAALVRQAMAVTALALLARSLRQDLGRPLQAADLDPALAQSSSELPARFRAVLAEALADPAVRAAVGEVLPFLPGGSGTDPASGPPSGTPRAPGRGSTHTLPQSIASPVAGIAVLLPGIARHGLHRTLTAAQLRAAAISTLGVDAQAGAATDPFLNALFPADPLAPRTDLPSVPAQSLELLPPAARALVSGRGGAEGWGDLLLATFAGRLPGLSGSSWPYLQRQFLHTPGRLDLSDGLAQVILTGPPLAVVLAMAGFDGDQGPLPHLDNRLLRITLSGLRR